MRHTRLIKAVLAAAAFVAAWVAFPNRTGAGQINLADLLDDPSASFRSFDATFEFSGFSYVPVTEGAGIPDPQSVWLMTDPGLAGGFRVRGPFQAINGAAVEVMLGFVASGRLGQGVSGASLSLDAPSAFGIDDSGATVEPATVTLIETVESLDGSVRADLRTFADALGRRQRSDELIFDPEAEFGTQVRASLNLALNSLPVDTGSAAVASEFSVAFVPEISSLALLAIGAFVLVRRPAGRHERVRGH